MQLAEKILQCGSHILEAAVRRCPSKWFHKAVSAHMNMHGIFEEQGSSTASAEARKRSQHLIINHLIDSTNIFFFSLSKYVIPLMLLFYYSPRRAVNLLP